jgi:hypothetical protein
LREEPDWGDEVLRDFFMPLTFALIEKGYNIISNKRGIKRESLVVCNVVYKVNDEIKTIAITSVTCGCYSIFLSI